MAQPTEKQYQVNDRIAMAVLEAGAGEPLVFLHGAGGLFWDPYLDQLSEHYKVYAPFMPGSGNSSGIDDIRDLWELVLCYYDLFDALGLDSVNVVGHSLGGMIASELAATDQSRVRRLLTFAPAGVWQDERPMADIFAMTPSELTQRVVVDPESPVAKLLTEMPEDLDEQVEVLIQRLATLQAAAKFLWPIPDKGLSRRMRRIKAPTLIIWGKQDGLIPVEYAQEFERGIPHARLEILDQASHLVQIEQLPRALELSLGFLGEDNLVAAA